MNSTPSRRSRMTAAAATAVAAAALLPATALGGQAEPANPVPPRFSNQVIEWTSCEFAPEVANLECGKFLAPMDWDNPADGRTVTIAASRLRATSGAASGSVYVSPGGPGAPARDWPLTLRDQPEITSAMDVVAIDLRGTGASSRVSCAEQGMPGDHIDPRDRGQQNLAALVDYSRSIAAVCQSTSGELGRYVNTKQSVHDIDLFRHLLDEDRMHFIVASGATWQAAHYTSYFPTRTGRVVLDSSLDFTSSWRDAMLLQSRGFDRRFRTDFADWAAKHHGVYGLGSTGTAVVASYERLRAHLVAEPIDLGDGTIIRPNTLDYGLITGSVYFKDNFPWLAQTITDLLSIAENRAGDPAAKAAARERVRQVPSTNSYYDGLWSTFWHTLCNDTPWPGGGDFAIRESALQGAHHPLIGWYTVVDPMLCQFWNRPALTMPTPNGAGVPPVLMVQNEGDPAAPIEGAQRAHSRFAGSRMITVMGEGDHGAFDAGNSCVDTAVIAYLVNGTTPTADSTCRAETPMPTPDSDSARIPTTRLSLR